MREKWWRGEKARESPDRELEDEMEEGLRKCEKSGGEGRRRGSLHTGRGREGGGIKKVREKWWRGEKARESTYRERTRWRRD